MGRQSFDLSTNVDVPNFARFLRRQQHILQQHVKNIEEEIQFLLFAPGHRFGVFHPFGERRASGRGLQKFQHGGAAFFIQVQIHCDCKPGAACR